jgi:exosortase
MSNTLNPPLFGKEHLPWWIVLVGLLGLYIPSLVDLFRGIWSTPEQGHGPLVLAVSLWMLYRQWPHMQEAAKTTTPSGWGWPVLVIGLLLYIVGRSQDILMFEIGSVIWMLSAIALLFIGPKALLSLWFPFFLMLFMVPLPGPVVDAVTMPMKLAV